MRQVIEYPLSPKYVASWTVGDALRELIANALDTSTEVETRYYDGRGYIGDLGPGIERAFWVMGEGEHGEIGQFGEGLKLALLVLAREGREVEVVTREYTVCAFIRNSDQFQTRLLVLEFGPGGVVCGTEVRVTCSKEEFEEAKGRFLKLRKVPVLNRKAGLLSDAGAIYVNGMYTQRVNALWGYNFTDKALVNRDRSVIDMGKLTEKMTWCLSELRNTLLITQLLLAASVEARTPTIQPKLELGLYPCFSSSAVRVAWRRGFKRAFGVKSCLKGEASTNLIALEAGWEVVDVGHRLGNALRYYAEIETSMEAMDRVFGQGAIRLKSPLTEKERRVWDQARRLAKQVVPGGRTKRNLLVERCPGGATALTIGGLYRNGTVYVARDRVQTLESAIGVLIHERLHGLSFNDLTREFENKLTDMVGTLVVQLEGKETR